MIRFWASQQHVDAMTAIGATPVNSDSFVCPFNVGDFITFPGFPHQVLRVASRLFRSGENPLWLVQLEPAQSPLD